jgi:hypothetical protein
MEEMSIESKRRLWIMMRLERFLEETLQLRPNSLANMQFDELIEKAEKTIQDLKNEFK